MNRRLLRPLFSVWDPFFSEPIYIKRVLPSGPKANRAVQAEEKKQLYDPHETFDKFFKDMYQNSSSLKAQEKQFFEKYYPERIAKKFNPYEVLGIDNKSDIQKVKQAYRTNAIKYHPKNNSSPEAKQKFQDISRAYNQVVNQKQTNDYGENVTVKSLFEEFNREMEDLGKIQTEKKSSYKNSDLKTQSKQKEESKTNTKVQSKKDEPKSQDKSKNNILKDAQLYSQSSYYEYINGKKKLHITRMYEKNGKTIKVDRTEQNRNDGSIQVTQTFDDGKEVQNRKYIEVANKKAKFLN